MTTLIAATDGSALGNPGPAGWAYFIDNESWASGSFTHATNNVAELHAVLELLRAVPDDVDLEVRADSQYVIRALAGMEGKPAWIHGWRRKGWRTASGAPVANQELIVAIDQLLTSRSGATTFVWVKAHQVGGDPWNEAADARANEAAQAAKNGRTMRMKGASPMHVVYDEFAEFETPEEWARRMVAEHGPMPDRLLRRVKALLDAQRPLPED